MPAPHQSTPQAGDAASPVDYRQSLYQTMIGLGAQPYQARGAMMSMMGESTQALDPKSYNPNDPGGSIGFANWNGPRRKALQSLAASMGTVETDPSAQVAYFKQEIAPGGSEHAAFQHLLTAKNDAEATKLWTGSAKEGYGYERPSENNWAQRYANNQKAVVDNGDGSVTFKTGAAKGAAPAATTTTDAATPAAAPALSIGEQLKAGNVSGALKTLTEKDEKTGKSKLDSLFPEKAQRQQAAPMEAPPMPAMQDPMAGSAPGAQALMAQVLTQSAKPLSWISQPYGSNAGPQVPGTTLNSMGG